MSRGSSGSKKNAGGGIRTKIMVSIGTLLVLVTLLTGFCLYAVLMLEESPAIRGRSQSPQKSGLATEKLASLLSEARTIEQQFHQQQTPAGVAQFGEVSRNLLAQALELEKNAKQGNDRPAAQAAAQIVQLVSQYNTSFRELVQVWEARAEADAAGSVKKPAAGTGKAGILSEALMQLGRAQHNYFTARSVENEQLLASAASTLAKAAGESGPATAELEAITGGINSYTLAFDRYRAVSLGTNDPALSSAFAGEQARQMEEMHKAALELEKLISGLDRAQVVAAIAPPAGQNAKIEELTTSLDKTYSALQSRIKALNAKDSLPSPGKGSTFSLTPRLSLMIIAGTWLAIVLLALLLARMLTASVTSPVQRMTALAHRMVAQDDFSLSFPPEPNEFGGLVDALNIMVRQQTAKAGGKANTAADLTAKAERVTRLIRDKINLDTRVGATFAAQEEVLGRIRPTVERLNADVVHLRQSIGALTGQSKTVGETAAGCEQSVTAAVENVQAITQTSEQMTTLITAHADLAEQTSVAALNAAIKGTRAGVPGKEFSAVTEELDRLANRSAETAKDLSRLLKNMNARLAAGEKLGKESLLALQHLATTGSALPQVFEEIDSAAGALQKATDDTASLLTKLGEISDQADSLVRQFNPVNQEVEDALALLGSSAGENAESDLHLEDMVNKMMRDYPEDLKGSSPSTETADQAGRA